jgi:hypothetical protein
MAIYLLVDDDSVKDHGDRMAVNAFADAVTGGEATRRAFDAGWAGSHAKYVGERAVRASERWQGSLAHTASSCRR